MKNSAIILLTSLFLLSSVLCKAQGINPFAGSKADSDSFARTRIAIGAAFARGDLDGIMLYHHPDVIKALAYHKYLKGREAVKAELKGTLDAYHLEFVEDKTESLYINGETVVEQSLFAIKGTPKGSGSPFVFKGRSMVVYVRYKGSPTGWASIREMIQPATD